MKAKRVKKLLLIITGVLLLAVVVGLVLFALRKSINLFLTPSQVNPTFIEKQVSLKLGGQVVPNSVRHPDAKALVVEFSMTDGCKAVTVHYEGVLPALFREGQYIIAQGYFVDDWHFNAEQVFAKHDENYRPPSLTRIPSKSAPSAMDLPKGTETESFPESDAKRISNTPLAIKRVAPGDQG